MKTKMRNIANKTAELLLEIEAVKFNLENPFHWSSGWLSPVYCDSRLTISYPEIRTFIKNSFVSLIKDEYPQVEGIAGVASAGVPQSALIADAMNLPLVYIRPKPKEHGMGNLIEGRIVQGQKIVVVEDIISTGGSSVKAVKSLQEAGFDVLGVVAILSYNFTVADQQFETVKVKYHTLSNYNALLATFAKTHNLNDELMASLHEWRKNPSEWKL